MKLNEYQRSLRSILVEGKANMGMGSPLYKDAPNCCKKKGTFLSGERQLLQNLATCAWGPRGLFQYKDVKKEEEKERSVMLRFFAHAASQNISTLYLMIIYVFHRAVLRQDDVDTFHGDEWRSRRHAAIVRCLSWNPRLCCSGLRTAFACVFFCASLSFNMWLLAFSSAKLVHICWLSSSGQIRLATWFSQALLESQHLSSLSPGVMFRCTEILFRKCVHSIWQQQFKWI